MGLDIKIPDVKAVEEAPTIIRLSLHRVPWQPPAKLMIDVDMQITAKRNAARSKSAKNKIQSAEMNQVTRKAIPLHLKSAFSSKNWSWHGIIS